MSPNPDFRHRTQTHLLRERRLCMREKPREADKAQAALEGRRMDTARARQEAAIRRQRADSAAQALRAYGRGRSLRSVRMLSLGGPYSPRAYSRPARARQQPVARLRETGRTTAVPSRAAQQPQGKLETRPAPPPPVEAWSPEKAGRVPPDVLKSAEKCRDTLVSAAKGVTGGVTVEKDAAPDVITLTYPGGSASVQVRPSATGISANRMPEGTQIFWLANDGFLNFKTGAEWLQRQAKFLALRQPVTDAAARLTAPGKRTEVQVNAWDMSLSVFDTAANTRQAYLFTFDHATGNYVAANGKGYPGAALPEGAPPSTGASLGSSVTVESILAYVGERPATAAEMPRPRTAASETNDGAQEQAQIHGHIQASLELALEQMGMTGFTVQQSGKDATVLRAPDGKRYTFTHTVGTDTRFGQTPVTVRGPGGEVLATYDAHPERMQAQPETRTLRAVDGFLLFLSRTFQKPLPRGGLKA